jgi:nitrite reductase (NADH) small subunit
MSMVTEATYVTVCAANRLTVNRGIAAMVDGHAVAVFALADGTLAAIDNIDPCSGASVLSRGIVGEVDGAPAVASPMYKQRFDLRNGRCLDVEGVAIAVHQARIVDGVVEIRLTS